MDKAETVMGRDRRISSPSLTREVPFVYGRASGMHIWDIEGRRYLDFTASLSVSNVGHANPEVRRAAARQMKKGIHCAFSDYYAETPLVFIEKLLKLAPLFQKAFLSNSGAESVEAAYKLARWHSRKKWAIAFDGGFHGRTMGALSLTKSKEVQRERFQPFLPVKHSPYPYSYRMRMEPEECSQHCLGLLEESMRTVRDDLAAVFVEPVQGEGGYVVPPRSFLPGVRKLCDQYGALLCVDEIQAGCFRTGPFLGIENFGVKPDIVMLAKALGGGFPLAATLSTTEIMDWIKGAHANTFGGNLVSCAAGIAVLDFLKNRNLGRNAVKIGKVALRRLQEIKEENEETVKEVRGIGLMIGIEIKDSRTRNKIIERAMQNGLLLLPAGDAVIRICPPLIINEKQAMKGLGIFEKSLA